MKDLLLSYVLPLLLWGALSGVLNLILTRKSQIEAWVNAHPTLAAWSKFLRSVGFDPWAFHAWLTLLVKKKLPEAQQANSPIAKLEQRKADAKALGVDPRDPPGGGGGVVDPQPTRIHFERPNDYPPDEPAECSSLPWWAFLQLHMRRRGVYLIAGHGALVLFAAASLVVVGCEPRKPPCDESQLRAISKRYIERVTVVCLAKYDRKEDCPEWPALKADHRRELREVCPQ